MRNGDEKDQGGAVKCVCSLSSLHPEDCIWFSPCLLSSVSSFLDFLNHPPVCEKIIDEPTLRMNSYYSWK